MNSGKLKNLLFTTDGKEYLTERHLEKEIRDHILLGGGRINRTDLQALSKVDLGHIERITNRMISQESDKFTLINGEILTRYVFMVIITQLQSDYMDSVCMEVDEMLHESGSIELGELTKRLVLPGEFVYKLISSRMGSIIQGRIEQDTLYTEAFVMREKARLCGVVAALTRPTPMSQLQSNRYESLFDPLIKDLSKQKRLFGQMHKGTTMLYVPKVFESAIQSAIAQFLSQNGYISHDRVESMLFIKSGANAAKNYLRTKFPHTLTINQYCITEQLRDQLDGSIENCIVNNTPVDLHRLNIIPHEFDQDDVRQIISICPSVIQHRQRGQDPIVIFAASYVLTNTLIQSIVDSFKQDALTEVKQVLSGTQKKVHKPIVKESPKKDVKKKKKVVEDEYDDEDDNDNDDQLETKRQERLILTKLPKHAVVWQHIKDVLKEDAPDEHDSDDADIIEELIEYLTPLITDLYLSQREIVLSAGDTKKQHQDLEKRLQDLYLEVLLNRKAIRLIPHDQDTGLVDRLCKFLLHTKCLVIVYTVRIEITSINK
jgi:hypothetical protein